MQMLFDEPIHVQAKGFSYYVPNPCVFAFHKILVMKTRKAQTKKEKDMLQIAAILREIKARPQEFRKGCEYLNKLPPKWQRIIKGYIKNYLPDFLPFNRLKKSCMVCYLKGGAYFGTINFALILYFSPSISFNEIFNSFTFFLSVFLFIPSASAALI